jgi:hypothetical protein
MIIPCGGKDSGERTVSCAAGKGANGFLESSLAICFEGF